MSFDLHSLGWKGFQDLCASVLSVVLGQTFEIMSAGADGGRDGAFNGTWAPQQSESLSGSFTVQCKHSSRPGASLRMADIEGDIRNAKLLQQQGIADVYILLTNMKVTQSMSARIKDRLHREANIESVLILGSEWISQKILEDDRLRMLVPRIYGLGDLSQILDERAYKQARKLLLSLQDDLRRFVRTHAYERAVKALEEFGFVCLIGEPACGKTTIAHTLALAAADRWQVPPCAYKPLQNSPGTGTPMIRASLFGWTMLSEPPNISRTSHWGGCRCFRWSRQPLTEA